MLPVVRFGRLTGGAVPGSREVATPSAGTAKQSGLPNAMRTRESFQVSLVGTREDDLAKAFGIVAGLVGLACLGTAGFLLAAHRPEIAAVAPPARSGFDEATIRRGEELALLANCNTCHTATGGAPYAGGLPIETPFGTIHATNITPDPDTGIGGWTLEAFERSMREGVDRAGQHLYPAYPYDHFTHASSDDIAAIYAYLMTREPVRAEPPANQLPFPLDQRALLAGWKLLFLDRDTPAPDPSRSAEWNRGRELTEGLGHCGACHTPRNVLGAVDRDRPLAGAEVADWYAYALDASSPAPVPWTVDSLTFYLRHGYHAEHGVSRGSMAPVTANLGAASEADVRAMATYIVAQMGEPTPERVRRGEEARELAARENRAGPHASGDSLAAPEASDASSDRGAAVFAAACASCHESGRALPEGGLNLHLSTALRSGNPQNVVNVTLYGLPAAEDQAGPIMPGFAGAIGEGDLVALLRYMRNRFGQAEPWDGLEERVRETVSGERSPASYRSDGLQAAPATNRTRTSPWP